MLNLLTGPCETACFVRPNIPQPAFKTHRFIKRFHLLFGAPEPEESRFLLHKKTRFAFSSSAALFFSRRHQEP